MKAQPFRFKPVNTCTLPHEQSGDTYSPPGPVIAKRIIFADLDLVFTPAEIEQAAAVVNAGGSAEDAAKAIGRDPWEAYLLCCHLYREGRCIT